ncbi:MAG: DUF1569 domain-containing protein [Candidatus Sulfotelmatobacter sp.]
MDSLLEELKQAIESAAAGMSDQQMSWHPAEKWCAAEVLEHLYLTYTGTIKGFERVLTAGKPIVGRASVKQRLRTLVALGFSHLPNGRKAPKQTVPRGLDSETVRTEVVQKLEAMDEIIAQCEVRFGHGKVLDHPILGPLTAAQWRKFHWIHGHHHVKQIVKLREQEREGETIAEPIER